MHHLLINKWQIVIFSILFLFFVKIFQFMLFLIHVYNLEQDNNLEKPVNPNLSEKHVPPSQCNYYLSFS